MSGDIYYLWAHTWPEVLDIIAKGDAVKSLSGDIWEELPNDHEKERLFQQWTSDIVYAPSAGHTISERVLQSFTDRQKQLTLPGVVPAPALLLPAQASAKKPFSWSYSALADFENCPLGYAHSKVYKDAIIKPWDHREWGNRVHDAVQRILKGKAMAEDIELAAPYRKYTDFLKSCFVGAHTIVEEQIAINEKLRRTDWFGADAWGRFVFDVAIIRDDEAFLYDWKTGKVRNDETQLKVFCAILALLFPKLKRFTAKFIWLKDDTVTGLPGFVSRDEVMDEWAKVLQRVERMRQAYDAEIWQAKPSGLCSYCGWVSRCEYKR